MAALGLAASAARLLWSRGAGSGLAARVAAVVPAEPGAAPSHQWSPRLTLGLFHGAGSRQSVNLGDVESTTAPRHARGRRLPHRPTDNVTLVTGDRYGSDVLAGQWRRKRPIDEVAMEPDLVVEDSASGFCGAVVDCGKGSVTLEDRHGRRRIFPMEPARFLLEGKPITLVAPRKGPATGRTVTASGSYAVAEAPARVAQASRIYVEGLHDAALVERVWGDDLRVEGVVVEPLHGIDDLPEIVAEFGPEPGRRLGVLVDHLVPGSKESRIVASAAHPNVLVTGHPYIDIWQAVKPERIGVLRWPDVPRGQPWKEGVCAALGVSDPPEMWRRILASVRTYADLETPLIGAVERLIDFVTVGEAG